MAGKHNIIIDMGADFVLPVIYKFGGVAVNLTTATYAGGLLGVSDTEATQEFTFSTVDAAQGVFSASLSEAETAAIAPESSRYYVDVIIGGASARLLQGSVRAVLPGGAL